MDLNFQKLQKSVSPGFNVNYARNTDSTSSLPIDENIDRSESSFNNLINYNSEPVYVKNSSRSKIQAIVSLNIGEITEKINIYEGQEINEIVSEISDKYKLKKEYSEFISEKIKEQIHNHKLKKKQVKGSSTDKLKKNENYPNTNNNSVLMKKNNYLNNSKIEREITKSPRQRTLSPIRTPAKKIEEKKNILEKNNLKDKKYQTTIQNIFKPNKTLNFNKKNMDCSLKNSCLNRTEKLEKNLENKINISPKRERDKPFSFIKTKNEIKNINLEKEKNEKFNQTVVVGKDLKIIENNIIFLPQAFIKNNKQGGSLKNFIENKINKKEKDRDSPNSNSEILLNYLQDIFNKLDDDFDGEISSRKIQLLNVDTQILEIIQDILVDMDEKNEILNFGKFLQKIEEFKLEIKLHNWIAQNQNQNQNINNVKKNNGETSKKTNNENKHSPQFSFGDLNHIMPILQKNAYKNENK